METQNEVKEGESDNEEPPHPHAHTHLSPLNHFAPNYTAEPHLFETPSEHSLPSMRAYKLYAYVLIIGSCIASEGGNKNNNNITTYNHHLFPPPSNSFSDHAVN